MRRFAHYFTDRPVLASVLSITIVVIGIIASVNLPRRTSPRDRAADGRRHRDVPRRERADDRGHGRDANRAGSEWCRRHAVYDVAGEQGRHDAAHDHVRHRDGPRSRAGARAEPRRARGAPAAGGGAAYGHFRPQELAGADARREPVLDGRPLRSAVSQQLRVDPDPRRPRAPPRRRRRVHLRCTRLQHARVAESGRARIAQRDGDGRRERDPRAERRGRGGRARPAARIRAGRSRAHDHGRRTVVETRGIRRDRHQDGRGRARHAPSRHRAHGARRVELRDERVQGPSDRSRDPGILRARVEPARDEGTRHPRDGESQTGFSARARLPRRV